MANTSIRLMCPNLRCRTLLAVPVTARGKNVRCRLCGTRIQVPTRPNSDKPAAAVAQDASAEPAKQEG
ncbi:MAG: hypothetical protein AB8C95_05175 [Phycisphaeraceae bacterium]